MLGLTLADFEGDEIEVWPENWPIVKLFREVGAQFIMGGNGPVGINYVPLFARMENLRLSPEDWDEMFLGFRVMESAAIDTINSK